MKLLLPLLLVLLTAYTQAFQPKSSGLASAAASRRAPVVSAAKQVEVKLSRPMGIVFEENSPDVGGIFAFELQPLHLRKFGAAVEEGDQLIAVNGANAKGLSFEDAMDMIIAAEEDALGRVSLTFLRDD